MKYQLDITNVREKEIYLLGDDFRGLSKSGEELAFTNYYLQKNGTPFLGISGELHFSRMSDIRWEDELIKMKMCGINVIATYVFWIHHEEEEGNFCFEGCRNLRKFIELCKKHGFYVILRVGPFDHGEVRNGGYPDWLYGKPFDVRKLSEGYLYHVKRLYEQIGRQVKGMFFQDDGPIIGVQIDNEYMQSAAPWENTSGISQEWIFVGDEGDSYMLRLKALAAESGLRPVFYTCTAWGGACTPDSMMPLWGGYAFRPWIYPSYKGEHPATEEYVYQDFHNNQVECTNDFKPRYLPEIRPYACCEMGGGMACSYNYRFQYPYKSVDAMANIKIASGCNFLGYYMFQGGSNPLGKNNLYLSEGQVPKISYDYQAPLGEYGQIRESYRRLKSVHYFAESFGDRLCTMQTVLPEGASQIAPTDEKMLRFAVRTDGKRGFLFINNYQDHHVLPIRKNEQIVLQTASQELFYEFGIASDENAILPFNFEMDGIELAQATAQPITRIVCNDEPVYVFMVPEGMDGKFVFEEVVLINGLAQNTYCCEVDFCAEEFVVEKKGCRIRVLVLSRDMANQMYRVSGNRLIFTDAALLEDENSICLETTSCKNLVYVYPKGAIVAEKACERIVCGPLEGLVFERKKKELKVTLQDVGERRYTIAFQQNFMEELKDVRLRILYSGDIGHAFLDGRLIHDNFANGAVWEIGLKEFAQELSQMPITLYITPLKEGARVNVESSMAARFEEVKAYIGKLESVVAQPVYEIELR